LQLTITTRVVEPNILVVQLEGRILLGQECTYVEDTVSHAIAGGQRIIVMDMAGVRSIDSSGLGTLTQGFGKMSKAGGRYYPAGARGPVLEILKMTHLNNVIPFFATADEACRKMAAESRAAAAKQS
jgi:anti-sigma B factor antagonist